jgi:hypothetical protein
VEEMDIRSGYLYFYSQLAKFYQLGGQLDLENLYANYIQNIYPIVEAMENYSGSSLSEFYNVIMMTLFILTLILSLTYLAIWTVIRLQIEKKKFNILLWFLDIPISYV